MSEIQENEQTKGTEIIEAGHIFDVSGSLPADVIEFINYFCDIVKNTDVCRDGEIEAEWSKWKELQSRKDTEIKPANTVKVMKIEYRIDGAWCDDSCVNTPSKYTTSGYTQIGSTKCFMCEHNQNKAGSVSKIVYCSKYTEMQAKAQNLKYSIV